MNAVLLQPRIARTWREPVQKIVVCDVDEKLGATLKNGEYTEQNGTKQRWGVQRGKNEQLHYYSMHIII
jgi:hypothetical protein